MPHKITKKIVSYKVVSKDSQETVKAEEQKSLESMHENVERPDVLVGSTYKIKTPQSEHALYITINDIILNQGTTMKNVDPTKFLLTPKIWSIFSGYWR